MNKVILIGRLTADPTEKITSMGDKRCCFTIAVNRNYYCSDGERKTDFFNVTAWGGLGETVSRYVKKGSKVAVSGLIEMRSYEDRHGVKRTAVDIIAQAVEFLSPHSDDKSNQDVERPTLPTE